LSIAKASTRLYQKNISAVRVKCHKKKTLNIILTVSQTGHFVFLAYRKNAEIFSPYRRAVSVLLSRHGEIIEHLQYKSTAAFPNALQMNAGNS
jgi:hypothetical protein